MGDTWGEAEAALNQVLAGKRKAAVIEARSDPSYDNGLRKTGQAVGHRRVRNNQKQASQSSPPLQRTTGSFTDVVDDWEAPLVRAVSPSICTSPARSCSSPARTTSPCRMTARSGCFGAKSQQLVQKAKDTQDRLRDHDRRRLRAKIATVMIEVRRRQDLHRAQEKQKKFRERRHATGRGPAPELGDTNGFALGLTCLSDTARIGEEQAQTSPRRTALLDSLKLEEFHLLRDDPTFFFTGNSIAAAVPHGTDPIDAGQSMSISSSDAGNDKAPKGLWQTAVDSSVFEDLIEFFSVSTSDKNLDVSIYMRHLRAQLVAAAGRQKMLAGMGADVDWRQRLCRRDEEESPPEVQPVVDEAPVGPLEMMPCLGRHPPIREDQASPTLLRVREVYERRDEQDAKWVDDRREGISRRLALNAFKAREQQRELLLQDFKQKELHKVRMLQAEEKKAMMDYEIVERTEVMGIQKIERMMVANERSERIKEEKRENVAASLLSWQDGVERAQTHIRKTEWEKRKDGERTHAKYMTRLTALGESRLNVCRSQGQKNDELKQTIQSSLCSQLKEQAVEESMVRSDACKAKQDAAAVRRHYATLGNRYCFVEKAFGANSVGFDAKSHSVTVDRRGKAWQKTAEGWAKTKGSFSAPVLPPARPLSPGGTLNESDFRTFQTTFSNSGGPKTFQTALTDSGGFKTETSAVALV